MDIQYKTLFSGPFLPKRMWVIKNTQFRLIIVLGFEFNFKIILKIELTFMKQLLNNVWRLRNNSKTKLNSYLRFYLIFLALQII
jgi:hypothetical protein